MLGLCPMPQVIVSNFCDLLMDGKNLITDVQEVSVLFVLQIINNTQLLLYQDCLCMLLLHYFDAEFYL